MILTDLPLIGVKFKFCNALAANIKNRKMLALSKRVNKERDHYHYSNHCCTVLSKGYTYKDFKFRTYAAVNQ